MHCEPIIVENMHACKIVGFFPLPSMAYHKSLNKRSGFRRRRGCLLRGGGGRALI